MTIPKYHTIGAKLIIAFAISTLLLTIVSLVAWGTWNNLDRRVSSLLSNSVPAYNASYLLESRSAQIRHLVNKISVTKNKSELDQILSELHGELQVIDNTLTNLLVNEDATTLHVSYQTLLTEVKSYYQQVSDHIDQTREINLLDEQIQWLHQDIGSELKPLRQEVQWQLQSDTQGLSTEPLLAQWNLIQAILDEEDLLYSLTRDILKAKHLSQVDNGIKVIQYKVIELVSRSKPIFAQPSAIAYQQLVTELSSLLATEGPLHQRLLDRVRLVTSIGKQQQLINDTLNTLHSRIAQLVANADEQFRQVRADTTAVISYGNHILVVCFSLSILTSLFLTYYFVNRRIVSRLADLSANIDAITKNQLHHPIAIGGKDEIARLSKKLKTLHETMQEMERTNALNLINNTQASLITCDLEGYVESVNTSAQSLFGHASFDNKHQLWEWLPPAQGQELKTLFAAKSQLHLQGADSITLSLGTEEHPHYLRFYLRVFSQGYSSKVIITVADITEQAHANYLLELRVAEKTQSLQIANQELLSEVEVRRQAEKHLKSTQHELIQAAKMAVVGQTMTSMAHELNQPLSAISTYLFSAKMAIEQQQYAMVTHSISHIESMTERMSKIINSLRHFAKKSPQDSEVKEILLDQVVEQALMLVVTKAKRQQTKIHNQIIDKTAIKGDSISLEQVLINLLVNALDAVAECEIKEVTMSLIGEGNGRHLIAISDTGNGFAPEVVDKLFTPFTTTKEVGLGLGLNISRSLIEKNHGAIYLASTLERGAMVVLELPYE